MRLQSKVAFNRRDLVQENYIMRTLNSIVTTPTNIKRAVFFNQQGASTALFDRSANAQNATLSDTASTLSPNKANIIRTMNFNGTTYFDIADADSLSFGNGSVDSPFTVIALLNPTSLVSNVILAKYDETTGSPQREWYLISFSTNKLYVRMYDNSTGGYIGRYYNTSLASDCGTWHVYAFTYSGSSTSAGIKIYRDGVRVDDQNSASGSYVAMENLGAKLGSYILNTSTTKANMANSKYGFIAVIAEELSQTQITNIHNLLINS